MSAGRHPIMDKFETPYDVEADFIECTVCEKSIRGETLYKIHLTTPGHRKGLQSENSPYWNLRTFYNIWIT